MKDKRIWRKKSKVVFGVMLAASMVMMSSVVAYADPTTNTQASSTTTNLGVAEVLESANTMCEAKALISKVKSQGITYNLTVECATQEIVDYLKKEFESIPLATLYNPVQIKLKSSGTTTNNGTTNNNSSTNNGTTNNNSSTNNGTTNNNCSTNNEATNNSCSTNNSATNNTTSNNCNNTTTSVSDSQKDSSPKTGDNTQVVLVMCIMAASGIVIVGARKKSRA